MKLKRYYVPIEFAESSQIVISGEEYHHLKNVMRTRIGDAVELFNGFGLDAEATVSALNKNDGILKINKTYQNKSNPSINLTIFQAACKGDKLSLITQKLTEIGASSLNIFYSDYTVVNESNKIDKLSKVSISACKQCGSSTLLKIEESKTFLKMIEEAKKLDHVFVAYENADGVTLFDELLKNAKMRNIGVIIGSEGGFSEKEVQIMQECGFKIVSLGKRILRAETASIACASLVMFALER